MNNLNLCRFSKSQILSNRILDDCPLGLNSSQAKSCCCRRRVFLERPCELRVLSCTFPNRWDGRPIDEADLISAKNVEIEMATKVEEKKPDKQDGVWTGTKIPVLGVTGEKASGKTLFVSSIDPEHTCMIDLEDSSESYSINYAKRVSLYDEMLAKHGRAATPMECFQWFSDFVDAIKPGEFSVLAVDPLSDIETGLVDWVKKNPDKFGHTAAQYERASGLLWADVKSHWKMMLGILSKKVETFAFTTHMGNVFKGGAPTGKRQPKGKETLFELASLYLELERKPDDKGKVDKKPSGKVLKSRLAVTKTIDGEIEHFPILPPRLPVATPAEIRKYIVTPPDYTKLKKGELSEPEKLSEDDKLEVQREIAAMQLETEQLRMSKMEILKQQTERQDDLRRRQAAAAAAAVNPESVSESKQTSTLESKQDSKQESIPDSPTKTDPTVYEVLESQKKTLGISEDQWKTILAKRSVTQTKDLTIPQAEEIRKALWNKITQRDIALAANNSNSQSKN